MRKHLYTSPITLLLFIFAGLIPIYSPAQFPEDFYQESVAPFTLPVGVTFDKRGYGYVWEKGGKVWVLDSNEVKLPVPLLDLSQEVAEWRDHGLLGFALDPDFLYNGHIYCLYTVDRHHLFYYGSPQYHPDSSITNQATIARITRFTADAATDFTFAPYESRKVLLGESIPTAIPIPNNLHGIGSLAFGDDGSLLASTGDGGPDLNPDFAGDFHIDQALAEGIVSPQEHVGPFRAQMLQCLNGKILRIDPQTGDGLPDNPFYDAVNPGSAQSKVWTLGIRNPYRMKVIPGSGNHEPGQGNPGIIVFGDVGEGLWEEINFINAPGLNCGWPIYEGFGKSAKWSGERRQNQYAPNPLYTTSGCDKAFFDFQDLLLPAREDGVYFWINPCEENQLIDFSIPRFYHHWPVLEYSNQMYNQPSRARTAWWGTDGKKNTTPLSSPNTPVKGANFDGFSAMAGFWYEQGDLPESYNHSYWIVDYSGWIKVLKLDENYQLTQVDSFVQFDQDIVDLAFNPQNQSIYFVDLSNSKLYKIAYGLNPPPVPVVDKDTIWGSSPLTVNFDATQSFHPKNVPFDFHWDFGDGQFSSLPNPVHTFTTAGTQAESFKVQLVLTDSIGKTSETTILVSLNNSPPQVKINSVADGDLYPVAGYTSLPLEAQVTDLEQPEEKLIYKWQIFLHHNAHDHPEPVDTNRRTFALIAPLGCIDELYYFRIKLEVSDPQGLTASDEVKIYPDCEAKGREVDLKALPQEQSVLLSWNLNDVSNLKSISVQSVTSNAENWIIGEVALNSTGTYIFEDLQPFEGVNQYRLQFNRVDGTYNYSNFAKVLFPAPAPISIFPNPAQETIHTQITNIQNQSIKWRLLAMDGRLLKKGALSNPKEDFVVMSLDISELPNGLYLMDVSVGDHTYREKVLIQR